MAKPKGATARQKSRRIEAAKRLIEKRFTASEIAGGLVKQFGISERTAERDYAEAKQQVAKRGTSDYSEQKAEILSDLDNLLVEHRANPDIQIKLLSQRIRMFELDAKYGSQNERRNHTHESTEEDGSASELAELLQLFGSREKADEPDSD